MEIRETYAAWAARIFEQNPDADIKATFVIDGCVGAHAYYDGVLIESYPERLHTWATAAAKRVSSNG